MSADPRICHLSEEEREVYLSAIKDPFVTVMPIFDRFGRIVSYEYQYSLPFLNNGSNVTPTWTKPTQREEFSKDRPLGGTAALEGCGYLERQAGYDKEQEQKEELEKAWKDRW